MPNPLQVASTYLVLARMATNSMTHDTSWCLAKKNSFQPTLSRFSGAVHNSKVLTATNFFGREGSVPKRPGAGASADK